MNKMIVDLQEYILEIEKAYGNRDAYRYLVGDTVVSKTFKQFKKDVYAVASFLVGRGWTGKHIAIIGSSSYHWVTAFLGIECSANVVIPIDRMLPEEEMLGLLKMGDVDAVFLSEEFEPMMGKIREAYPDVLEVISFSDTRFREILRTEPTELPKIDPDALAEILFTSGTTGVSKGVMLSQRNIVSNINDIYRMDYAQNVKRDPVVLSVLPIHHTFELTVDNLGVLFCGATVCINDKIENIVSNLNRFKPSVILVVPTIAEVFYKKVMESISSKSYRRKIAFAKKLNRFLKFFRIDARRRLYKKLLDRFGGDLTNVIVGGAALRPEIAEAFDEFGINMYQGYGLTECAPLISANYPKENKFGSVGKPVSYMDVKFDGGEILVKGSGVMLGYYKNPEATADAFTEDGYLRTGDLGHMDHEGYLYITGRSKNLIILDNGKNVYPEELEAHIAVIDGVKDVLVYESKGKICAAIQPTDLNDSELVAGIKQGMKRLNATLPSYKKIVETHYIARDFPKTTTLKIKRSEAVKMLNETLESRVAPYVPPTTEEQKKIVSVFESVLGRKKVGVLDNFFDLGGYSLLAFEAAALLGVQAQEIYDNPTAEQLERVLLAIENGEGAEDTQIDVNELIKHNTDLLHAAEIKYVLLTGATGFLGSHILRELLRRGLHVICLVRDAEKLKSTLKYYFPKEHEYFRYKVRVGNIEDPKLGLDDEEYDQLLKKVNMVIHTAANVNHTGKYEKFERTNVQGTQHVIDFCMRAGAVLQHTSTASVHGSGTVRQLNPDATFDEFSLDIGQNHAQNVYIHSKYKAEELVLLAREEGLEANIIRIGNLTWRMSDGRFQKNPQSNGFLGRFRGLLKVGKYSKELSSYPIDFTPVDECADAYVRLALNGRVNNIYNLYHPQLFTVDSCKKKFFLRIKRVSHEEFEKSLKESIDDKDVAVLFFYNSIALASKNIPVSNVYTVNELKKVGFKWSKIGIRYLNYMKKI